MPGIPGRKEHAMTLTPMQFLIVCPLVFLAGYVDAVAGGGGLISLPAYMIAGLPTHFAIGTNKLSSMMGTSLTTFRFARKGFIPLRQGALCAICALIGSRTGATVALNIEDSVFKCIMLVIIPLTFAYITFKKQSLEDREPFGFGKTLLISMGIALVIGLYDGFYGPGTGTFLILLLTSAAHMKLSSANGVAKAINLATNVAALAVYALNARVLVPLGLVAGVFGIAGNYLGSRAFLKKGSKLVRPLMLVVLMIFFIKIVGEML